jgi:hypothetical protein
MLFEHSCASLVNEYYIFTDKSLTACINCVNDFFNPQTIARSALTVPDMVQAAAVLTAWQNCIPNEAQIFHLKTKGYGMKCFTGLPQ